MYDKQFDTGDRIQAFADGELRTVTIEMVTTDRRIAQCSYIVGNSKRYGMCTLQALSALAQSFEPRKFAAHMA
jgi:hypothetical protein